ncbi:MAG: P-loop NTPase, partial [Clostridia bacterium]|nr:P-loop NTPase [Clostridia bacterium]
MGIFKRNKKSSLDTNVPKIVVGKRLGASESYYRLKDNILYYSDNGKNKVFYCESSVAGEGKSTVVINLAVALAKSGKKVVLLDLDFRRPKIHRAFNIVNLEGITEY